MMAPAGLSILTTSFNSGDDRSRALGVWGAISGLAAAAGVFLGGVLSQTDSRPRTNRLTVWRPGGSGRELRHRGRSDSE
jgi:MFS family permease